VNGSEIAFYSTVAQLLPVLVIFAAIELRFLKPDDTAPRSFKKVRLVLVLVFCPLILLAEQASLMALMNNHVSTVFTKLIIFWISMICVGIVLLAPAIFHLNQLEKDQGDARRKDPPHHGDP
jgi:hypothetical protein